MFWSKYRAFTLIPVFLLIIVASYFLYKVLKNKEDRKRMLPITIVTIVLLVLEFFKQLLSIIRGYDLYHIPLHFCSLFLYFLPLAVFYKGKLNNTFRVLAGVISTCLFLFMSIYPLLIYPDADIDKIKVFFSGEDIYRFFQFHSVVFHNIALLPFFFFAFGKVCEFDTKKDIKAIVIAFAIYAVIAGSLANIIDTNFNNFRSCNADFLENVRVGLVDSMGAIGQLIYVLIIGVGTILVPIAAYFILKLFTKAYEKVELGLNVSFVLGCLVSLGIILFIINHALGMVVCSIFLVLLLSSAIPTLINAIKSKQVKYMICSGAFLLVGIIAMILEFMFL